MPTGARHSLKYSILRNSIGECTQPLSSYAFFRISIEGIHCTPRNQRTSNSQEMSQRSNGLATYQHSNAPETSQRSNAPWSNNTRFTQRTNIPAINADETSCIVKNNRARNVSLPWLTGGVKLCTNYCIIGLIYEHVVDNCSNGVHATYDELSPPNQNIVSRWLDTRHSLS